MVLSRKIKPGLIAVLCVVFILFSSIMAEQIAFPGAAGPGKHATGGRGGAVYKVTNLRDDYSEGSLRWAINQGGTRTIVFEVAGTIELSSVLKISRDNLTIAGQTAPGDGICLKGYSTRVEADNVIIRYIRFRMGDINQWQGDALSATDSDNENIIIDHCSFSWSIDETVSMYDNRNMTLQWCMVTESLHDSYHEKGEHGYGGIWGGRGAAFHHNLIAHHTSRNPRFCGARYHGQTTQEVVDYRNNVIYNWGGQSVYGGEQGNQNMVANYYKYGPATGPKHRIAEPSEGNWYIADNFVYGYPEITEDNWDGGIEGGSASIAKVSAPAEIEHAPTHTPSQAYQLVLANAGTVLPNRDPIDSRIVEEVKTQTATYGDNGIIDSQSEVGGWPELESGTPPADSDNDGMADEWETENGLNPDDASDRNGDLDGDGYTNLEEYLNSLTKREDFINSPAQLETEAISKSEIKLSWQDNVVHENGFTIERSENDTNSFEEIGTVGTNDTTFTDEGLSPETQYFYRVKAYHASASSVPCNVDSSTTLYSDGRPVKVESSRMETKEDVDVLPMLAWEPADGATEYDIYLGTSENPELIAENVPTTSYRVKNLLENNTTYYWRVDAKNEAGTTEGEVWQFETGFYKPYLAGYWALDLIAGGYTPDSTYLQNWAFLSDGMKDDEGIEIEGKAGTALSFDGNNDYVYMRTTPQYDFGAKSFTISMWVKMDDDPGAAYIFSKGVFPGNSTARGFAIYCTSDGELVFHVGDGESESMAKASISEFVTGEWVKLTAIRNREMTELQIYKNSEKVASSEDESWDAGSYYNIYVGAKSDMSHFYKGGIDNIRMTNYALDASEVGELNTTDIEKNRKPENYTLELKNYPNPFNPVTKINYVVPSENPVSLMIYNIKGELVKTLIDNKIQRSGKHIVNFDGSSLSSGIYISRLKVGNQYKTTKMMLIK